MIEEQFFKKSHKCYKSKKINNSNYCKECGIFFYPRSTDLNKKIFRTPFFEKQKTTSSFSNWELKFLYIKEDKKMEKKPLKKNFMSYHSNLINWIVFFVDKLDYSKKTLHLAISFINRIFSNFEIIKTEIKLISFICLFLAAKMEESIDKVPNIKCIVKFFDNKFTEKKFKNCEKEVFQHLNYNLNIKTTYDFFMDFYYRGIINGKDLTIKKVDQTLVKYQLILFEEISFHLLEYSLQKFEFLQFKASSLAAVIIACTRKIMGFENFWNENLKLSTLLSWSSIKKDANFFFDYYIKDCKNKFYYFMDKAEFIRKEKINAILVENENCDLNSIKRKDSIMTQCESESNLDLEEDLKIFSI